MQVTLARAPSTPQGTFGVWSIDGVPTCVTCELPWKNNAPEVSCIPSSPVSPETGFRVPYHCVRHVSEKFPLGNTWEITNVPGRSEVLVHNANSIADLKGCVAVGSGFGIVNDMPAVINSVATLAMLNDKLPDEYDLIILQA
jgi:Family of unknown function (DUF5675)